MNIDFENNTDYSLAKKIYFSVLNSNSTDSYDKFISAKYNLQLAETVKWLAENYNSWHLLENDKIKVSSGEIMYTSNGRNILLADDKEYQYSKSEYSNVSTVTSFSSGFIFINLKPKTEVVRFKDNHNINKRIETCYSSFSDLEEDKQNMILFNLIKSININSEINLSISRLFFVSLYDRITELS